MPALEICGVVLGVIPLVISALEHYKAGKGAAAAFVKWRGHLDTLIFRLKLQRTFFYLQILELLREARVAQLEDRIDLTEEQCVAVLCDKHTGEEVREYLGLLHDTFVEVLSRYELCLKTIVAKIGHIRRLPDAQKDDLAAILAANTSRNGTFSFRERLSFTIERGSLKGLLEELRENRLSLKTIIKGLKTQREYLAKEPSHDAQRLAANFREVQQTASALFPAMCKCCSCPCMTGHGLLLRLDNRVPIQRVRAKVGKRADEPTTFSLFMGLEKSLQEISVNAYHMDPTEESPVTAKFFGQDIPKKTVDFAIPTLSITVHEEHRPRFRNWEPISDICHSAMIAFKKEYLLRLHLMADALSLANETREARREVAKSTTLEQFLRRGCLDEDARMTPKQQTILALDIAASVLQLRQTHWSLFPWTNKRIRFLLSRQGELLGPFVEELIDKRTGKTPLDPIPQGPDPKEALLELAILLLEIWHHRPLEMWAAKLGMEFVDTPEARRIAAIRWLELTSDRLPPHHLAAIEQCLAFCSGRLRAWDDGEFQKLYCENVVKPLRESCKAWQA
ncbi:hypothetical protein J7T55_004645 [Diaporthe amygdali]|uniref:uncharacterized protein n=1 Tax=Phomopsis amygdali TaxID=1214568 RepID=UPI0022FEEF8C|nr:uncharacterized protein J7T55_004645 [Diaporthe amygdali]KAJ0114903.1 hypothetical protein J7T55_004645 [Diaporthe amygdali]